MFLANGKKVGGYSLESYEPTDISEEEKNQSYNFTKTLFDKKIYSRNNYNLNYNYPIPVLNNKNVSISIGHIPTLSCPTPIQNSFHYNKLNNSFKYPTINNMKLSNPTIVQYSNKTKIVYPSQTLIINNNNTNNNIIQKTNYIERNIAQPIHISKTTSFIPTINRPFIVKNYNINGNNYVMPNQPPRLQQIAIPKITLMTNKISPIYPTITYRRRIIY